MTEATTKLEFDGRVDTDEVEHVVRSVLESHGVKNLTSTVADDGTVRMTAETPATLLSWGETIVVELTNEEIRVESHSEQLVDWGRTKRNVERIVDAISQSSISDQAEPEPA